MSLAICPSPSTGGVLGAEIKTGDNMDEDRVEMVLTLIKLARNTAESLFRDLGLNPGEMARVGRYLIQGRDFCALPIWVAEEKVA